MKVLNLENLNDFLTSKEAASYETISVFNLDDHRVRASALTECKSYKTALKRFFNALNDNRFDGWYEYLLESCSNGSFSGDSGELYGWEYSVEQLGTGTFYIKVVAIF